MLITLAIIGFLSLASFAFLQHPKFGKLPSGERLERIEKSPNFKDGSFKNLQHTPDLTEGATYYDVMKEFLFGGSARQKPVGKIPSMKTDLHALAPDENVLVWFGHSSYFMQIDGKRILVDPVLHSSISPLGVGSSAFAGTEVYTAADIPEIDYLFISHDHWDHLDYEAMAELQPKIKKVICGLGTGAHFEHWGYDTNIIVEKDWNEEIILDAGFRAYTIPARHFSGRALSRNNALWTAYVLKTPTQQIFIGGDSGYDTVFKETGERFGPFDLAILENGQYDKSWKYIHMMPDEVAQAAKDLGAKRLFPVHSSKFVLANHAWDEPLIKITEYSAGADFQLVTPMIGEQVFLKDTTQKFSQWWKGVK